MILRLMKSGEPRAIGDLIRNTKTGSVLLIKDESDIDDFSDQWVVVKPYAIVIEDVNPGDAVVGHYGVATYEQGMAYDGKVVIHPHQFVNEDVIKLGLRDGSKLCCYLNDGKYRLMLCESKFKLNNNLSLESILNEFGNQLILATTFKELGTSRNDIATFTKYFLSTQPETEFNLGRKEGAEWLMGEIKKLIDKQLGQ
jgi:hypothetical protein